jgi:hypothetical protein
LNEECGAFTVGVSVSAQQSSMVSNSATQFPFLPGAKFVQQRWNGHGSFDPSGFIFFTFFTSEFSENTLV